MNIKRKYTLFICVVIMCLLLIYFDLGQIKLKIANWVFENREKVDYYVTKYFIDDCVDGGMDDDKDDIY